MEVFRNLLAEGLPSLAFPVGVVVQVVKAFFPFQVHDGPPGQELHVVVGPGEAQPAADIHGGGCGRPHMDFFGPVPVEEAHGPLELGPPDDGVVHEKELFVFDEAVDGDQLHPGYLLPLTLELGGEGPGPGGGVLDHGPGIGEAGFVGVAQGVADAGVGDANHGIQFGEEAPFLVLLGHEGAVPVPDGLDVDTVVDGGGIAVVGPEEGTDFFFLPGGDQLEDLVFGDLDDLSGADFLVVPIAQLLVGEGFKTNSEALIIPPDHDGDPALEVPDGDDGPVGLEDEEGHGSVNDFLDEADAVDHVLFHVHEGGDEFAGVDSAAGDGVEVGSGLPEIAFHQLVLVVEDAGEADGIGPEGGVDEEGLGVPVGDAGDGRGPVDFFQDVFETGPEGGVFDVVDLPLKAFFGVIAGDAGPVGSQVGEVVRSVEDVFDGVPGGHKSKKCAHVAGLLSVKEAVSKKCL